MNVFENTGLKFRTNNSLVNNEPDEKNKNIINYTLSIFEIYMNEPDGFVKRCVFSV